MPPPVPPVAPPAPVVPADVSRVKAHTVMQAAIPFVRWRLASYLGVPGGDIGAAQPLAIDAPAAAAAGSGEQVKSGFKEVWKPANALTSIRQNNLYEAGGSLAWLDTMVDTAGKDTDELLRETVGWQMILDLSAKFFDESASTPFHSTPGVTGVKPGVRRLIFPGEAIDCYVSELSSLWGPDKKEGVSFPQRLIAITGHPLVWAWYWSTYKALGPA